MYRQLRDSGRLNETVFLAALCAICLGLSVFRLFYTKVLVFFVFLNWNLFLAFLPWLFSSVITIYPGLRKNRISLVLLASSWLLFFPNSFYILTDLFHLQIHTSIPKWFDLVLILSYAWTGMMFGIFSLWDIEKILETRISKNLLPVISSILLFLGSFGIYLGRYLRWNSWDIITEPFNIMYDIGERVLNPLQHKGVWGVTLAMFTFLSMVYWSLRFIRNRD